jgi:hypothetical protein
MIAITLLAILCVALAVLALLLWVYAQGCKADYEEAREDAEYYYQLADGYATQAASLKEALKT